MKKQKLTNEEFHILRQYAEKELNFHEHKAELYETQNHEKFESLIQYHRESAQEAKIISDKLLLHYIY
jgi:hypothetical protein